MNQNTLVVKLKLGEWNARDQKLLRPICYTGFWSTLNT